MAVHWDYRPTKDCTNPDTYGEICVKCNDCGRFDYTCLNCEVKKKPETLGGQVELVNSFRESICRDCLRFFSEEELSSMPKVIWTRKEEFEAREEEPNDQEA